MRTNTRKMGLFLARPGKGLGLLSVVILPLTILCVGQPATQHVPAGVSTRANIGSNWSEFHRRNMVRWNPHEKILNVKTVRNLKLKWSYATGGSIGTASPAVVNDVVYICAAKSLYALDAETGANLWTFTTGEFEDASVAVADGVVYFPSCDGYLYALDASTGTLIWKHGIGYPSDSPAVEKGIVYVGVGEYEGPTIYALSAKTGRKIWTYEGGWINTEAAIANGIVYFGELGGGFYALNANTGALLWDAYLDGSPAVTNGVVYVEGIALDARTGALRWSYPSGVGANVAAAVANGVVYFADFYLYALNAKTGAKLWRRSLAREGYSSPAVAGGVVYIGSTDDNLYAFNAKTGAKLWSDKTGDGVLSSPVVANGVVYVGSLDGNVYAFGLKK